MNKKEERFILSENLKRLLKESRISRREIAKAINVEYATFCDWARGRTYPKYNQIKKIADYIKVPISSLTEPRESQLINEVSDYEILENKERIQIIPIGAPVFDCKNIVTYEYIPKYLALGENCYGFKIFDNSMEPEYKIGDTVIVKQVNYINSDGDYLLCDSDESISPLDMYRFTRVYSNGGDILIAPLNIKNEKGWLSEKMNQAEYKQKYRSIAKVIRVIRDYK